MRYMHMHVPMSNHLGAQSKAALQIYREQRELGQTTRNSFELKMLEL